MSGEFLHPLLQTLENSAIASAIRRSNWLFPTIETVHVIAIVTVVGTISVVDLRLLGFTGSGRTPSQVMEEMLPYTWVCFVVAVITGSLLFASSAVSYAVNPPFQLKFLLLIAAGINMALFQRHVARSSWHTSTEMWPPARARLAGGLSLLCWIGVIVAGRWIGFWA